MEEILEYTKQTIIELEQRGRENLAALTTLQRTIDAQLIYIQQLKSIIQPALTSLPQLIVANATPGTSFTLHTINYTSIYGHHKQLTIPAYSNRRSDHLRRVIHHI